MVTFTLSAGLAIAGCDAGRSRAPSGSTDVRDQTGLATETIPPGEAAAVSAIAAGVTAQIKRNYPPGTRALRDAHAKAHGCVSAHFIVEPELPEILQRGVFATARAYPAWVRFSNGSGARQPDNTPDGRGMAIKLMDVPGEKLLDAERDARTQDFVMINFPVFFVANVADYVSFFANAQAFFASHSREAANFRASAGIIPSPLETQYFSMTPYMLGDGQAVKFSARPCVGQSPDPLVMESSDYLQVMLAQHLDHADACFDFLVQMQKDAQAMPIEDPTLEWDQARSPFVKVARLIIPAQSFDGPEQMEFCDNLSFTPWHSLPEHRPLGGINRARRTVYQTISQLRHDLNHAPRVEPDWDGEAKQFCQADVVACTAAPERVSAP
jgi:hypothetical protein